MSENGLLQAEARVREMNRMTRQYAEQGNSYMRQNRQAPQTPQQYSQPQQTSRPQQRQTRFEPVRQTPPPERPPKPEPVQESAPRFTEFKPDGEKLMILLIMYVLIKEKADMKLILALGYLLL